MRSLNLLRSRRSAAHSDIVWHLPHDATEIPLKVRDQFVLADEALAGEILRMTDHATMRLFGLDPYDQTVVRAPVSRLVVDVERFPDDADEPMAARGMGVIYQAASDGRPLRRPLSPEERQSLLDEWYCPHHRRLEAAVDQVLARHGLCLLIDCHSFPSKPLPYEPDQNPVRPEICLGTDDYHTPDQIRQSALDAFRSEGFDVAVNRPFAGALVPLSRYRKDPRVSALMVEVNRGLYMDESNGCWLPSADALSARIQRALAHLQPPNPTREEEQ